MASWRQQRDIVDCYQWHGNGVRGVARKKAAVASAAKKKKKAKIETAWYEGSVAT